MRLILIFFMNLAFLAHATKNTTLDAEARIQKIIDIYFEKKYSEAEIELNKLIKEYPSLPKMQLLKGQILLAKKEFQKSLEALNKVPISEQGTEYWYFKFSSASQLSDQKHKDISKQSALQLLKDPFISDEMLNDLLIFSAKKENKDIRPKICSFIKERFKNSPEKNHFSCGEAGEK